MPTWVVDIGLSTSITLSVLILMVAIWIEKPLDFSSFPTVLLVATLLRLALNLATVRLILAGGHKGLGAAGSVIKGFAAFVVGGDFVIGVVVFAILVVINFMVITKGAGRIAEVAARFSLDAMPGKQMAIDADLSAGMITEEEARRRRKELEEESSFFGAMDGASKFVRGDAIAAIIITLVNAIGGIVVGMLRHGLTIDKAATFYTTLTIGDGIVSQIPALIVSLGAGMLVSKGSVRGSAHSTFISPARRPREAAVPRLGPRRAVRTAARIAIPAVRRPVACMQRRCRAGTPRGRTPLPRPRPPQRAPRRKSAAHVTNRSAT